jgi:hypothetical protein
VDFLAHSVTEGGVYELVPLHPAFPLKCLANYDRLEMLAIPQYFKVVARQIGTDTLFYAFRCDHWKSTRKISPVPGDVSSMPEFIPGPEHEKG